MDQETQNRMEKLIFGNLFQSFDLERETSKGDDVTEVKDLHLEEDYESLSGQLEQMTLVKKPELEKKLDPYSFKETEQRKNEQKELDKRKFDFLYSEILTVTPEMHFRSKFNPRITWNISGTKFKKDDKIFIVEIISKKQGERLEIKPEIALMREIERQNASKDDELVWGIEHFVYLSDSHLFDSYSEWYKGISGHLPNKTLQRVPRAPHDYFFLRVECNQKYYQLCLITKRKWSPRPNDVTPNHLILDISGDVLDGMTAFLLHPTKMEKVLRAHLSSADWLESRTYSGIDNYYFGEKNSAIIMFHKLIGSNEKKQQN